MRIACYALTLVACMACPACWTPGNNVVRSVDRTGPRENDKLWRQSGTRPLRFVPRGWPVKQTGPGDGKWLTDPQDQTAYFIPAKEYENMTPGVWQGEARKHLNLYGKAEQGGRNLAAVLIGFPLEVAGLTAAGMALGAASVVTGGIR